MSGTTHGKINVLSDTDAAYIAGLIDADGTVTVSYGGKSNLRPLAKPLVLVVNSNYDLICWLALTIGAGTSYETKTRPTRPDQNEANWNKVHRFQLTGLKGVALLMQVRRFMRIKNRQADLVSTLPMRGRDFTRAATDEQRALSFAIGAEVQQLNKRGLKS